MVRQWLKDARIHKGLTQKKVSELIEISQPSYHQIECGDNNPSVETAKKIAAVLGFDWTEFFPDETKGA